MAITIEELNDVLNSTLPMRMNGKDVERQEIRKKPIIEYMDKYAGDRVNGGDGTATCNVSSGKSTGALKGFSYDDQVEFYNPTGIKVASYKWREHHIGMGITHTELKNAGIEFIEGSRTSRTSPVSKREENLISMFFEEKLDTFMEDHDSSWEALLWGDGSADAKGIAGVKSFLTDVPNTGSTGSISRTTNPWWQSRAATVAFGLAGGQGAITSSATGGGTLIKFIQQEFMRNLTKFSNGKHIYLCGSDFLSALEDEVRANGGYSDTGFSKTTDISSGNMTFKGREFMHDHYLDETGEAKRCYVIDTSAIKLHYGVDGKKKMYSPARPHDRFVMYRSIVTDGFMGAKRLNTSGVYEIA